MKLRCSGWQQDVEVPDSASDGYTFDCANWAGTTLRFRRNPDRIEIVPRASCPVTGETVLLPEGTSPGTEAVWSCGHSHRATYEYGAWALEDWPLTSSENPILRAILENTGANSRFVTRVDEGEPYANRDPCQ